MLPLSKVNRNSGKRAASKKVQEDAMRIVFDRRIRLPGEILCPYCAKISGAIFSNVFVPWTEEEANS